MMIKSWLFGLIGTLWVSLMLLFLIPSMSFAQSSLSILCDEYREVMPREKIVQILREENKPGVRFNGKTMLYYSAVLGFHDKLKDWVQNKKNLINIDHDIMVAVAAAGDPESISILVHAGVNPDLATDNGSTALIVAAECGRLNVMTILIEFGANIQARNDDGIDPLIESVMVGNLNSVRLLVNSGFDVRRSRTKNGLTPIDLAKKKGNKEILDILTKKVK